MKDKIRELEQEINFKDESLSVNYNIIVELYKLIVQMKGIIEEEFDGMKQNYDKEI